VPRGLLEFRARRQGGGIGRRAGFKIRFPQGAGSLETADSVLATAPIYQVATEALATTGARTGVSALEDPVVIALLARWPALTPEARVAIAALIGVLAPSGAGEPARPVG